jgi:hypothetical protein
MPTQASREILIEECVQQPGAVPHAHDQVGNGQLRTGDFSIPPISFEACLTNPAPRSAFTPGPLFARQPFTSFEYKKTQVTDCEPSASSVGGLLDSGRDVMSRMNFEL